MLKRIIAVIMLSSTMVCLPSYAAQDVAVSMHQMGHSYQRAMQDKTLASLKSDLSDLKTAVQKARDGVPSFLQNKPADDPKLEMYRNGLNRLLKQIKIADDYIQQGNLSKAKETLSKIGQLKHYYHRKLGV